MQAKLIPLETNSARESVILDRFPVVIGRSSEADLPLYDRWVSRRHCELFERDGVLVVRDLGSKHGTLVNNSPVGECRVLPGDKLSVGLTSYRAVYRRLKAKRPSAVSSTSSELSPVREV